MKTLSIEIPDDLADQLEKLAKLCTDGDQARDGATTHGPLTVPALLAMLAEDAGMVLTRPGSWEGSNMDTVFSSHGYQL
ncbi:MAG: hypothetical protein PHI71_01265 [Acidiphilium sp.]|jgi:hypothetical protein|nr:hypothetical protein [Acidiphilium sp.]